MVRGALHGHRGDVTLYIEQETCIYILVVSDAVAETRKLARDDVWLSRFAACNRKIRRVKGPGSVTVQKVRRVHAALVLQEFMEWLTDPSAKKVRVSTLNLKWTELRHLQGIYTYVYHPNVPIHDSQRMSYMFRGQFAIWYTSFTADSETEF